MHFRKASLFLLQIQKKECISATPLLHRLFLLVPIAFCYYLTTIYWLPLFPIPSCTSLYKSKGGIAAGEKKKEISFVCVLLYDIRSVVFINKAFKWAGDGTLETSYKSLVLRKMPPTFRLKNISLNSPAPAE